MHNYSAIQPHIPNLLTFSRMPAVLLIVTLMLLPWPGMATLALLVFIAASATDWLDGYIARKWGAISRLGKFMDALVDKIFVISMLAALLAFQILPVWALPLVIIVTAREFLVTGLRLVAARAGKTLAAEAAGKYKMIFQLTSIGLLLSVRSFIQDGGLMAGDFLVQFVFWLGIATFLVATLLTAISGAHYVAKYWNLLDR